MSDWVEDLYESGYPRLVAQVTVVVGDRGLAEDAVQEAFVRLLSRWRRISSYDDPAAWVRRVAVRIAIDRYRRERDRPGRARDDAVRAPVSATGRADPSLPADRCLWVVSIEAPYTSRHQPAGDPGPPPTAPRFTAFLLDGTGDVRGESTGSVDLGAQASPPAED